MSESITIELSNRQQAWAAINGQLFPFLKSVLQGGHRWLLTVKPESKTREQEQKYHAMIGEVSKQAEHLGCKWSAEDWKRLLLDKFARETGRAGGKIVPNLDKSGVVEVGIQSRKFSVTDGSEFIEWLYAWGSENGIEYST